MSDKSIILVPHLDDEIIGCYPLRREADAFLFFTRDYRADLEHVKNDDRYIDCSQNWERARRFIDRRDVVYLPSLFDYHPVHKAVNRFGKGLPGTKMFYSVEMNVPWLEEEFTSNEKRTWMKGLYPVEYESLKKNDKYFLFKSIKSYDDYIWASVKFQREFFHAWPDAPGVVGYLGEKHRHILHIQVDVQQFGNERDVEYHQLSTNIQDWWDDEIFKPDDSCESVARKLKTYVEVNYSPRAARVSVYEDGENGCVIE